MVNTNVYLRGRAAADRPRVVRMDKKVYQFRNGVVRHPRGFDHKNVAVWDQVARPGRAPATRLSGRGLAEFSWEVEVGKSDWRQDCEPDLRWFSDMARLGIPCYVTGDGSGKFEKGITWYVSDHATNVTQRTPQGRASRATISLTFTEYVDVNPKASVQVKAAPRPPKKPSLGPARRKITTYKVKKGDTLWALSRRFLGNPLRWKEIARDNGVKNPRLLQIGHVLKIRVG